LVDSRARAEAATGDPHGALQGSADLVVVEVERCQVVRADLDDLGQFDARPVPDRQNERRPGMAAMERAQAPQPRPVHEGWAGHDHVPVGLGEDPFGAGDVGAALDDGVWGGDVLAEPRRQVGVAVEDENPRRRGQQALTAPVAIRCI
jgi:hypothetical protein